MMSGIPIFPRFCHWDDDINVLYITETHLKNSVLDAEIEIEGYKFFRKEF